MHARVRILQSGDRTRPPPNCERDVIAALADVTGACGGICGVHVWRGVSVGSGTKTRRHLRVQGVVRFLLLPARLCHTRSSPRRSVGGHGFASSFWLCPYPCARCAHFEQMAFK